MGDTDIFSDMSLIAAAVLSWLIVFNVVSTSHQAVAIVADWLEGSNFVFLLGGF